MEFRLLAQKEMAGRLTDDGVVQTAYPKAGTTITAGAIASASGQTRQSLTPSASCSLIPCGARNIAMIAESEGKPAVIASVSTADSARRAALDPRAGKLYLPIADFPTGRREEAPLDSPGHLPCSRRREE